MMKIALALLVVIAPTAALAAPQVTLTSHISVVRTKLDASGKPTTSFEEPKLVTPGDKLSFTLDYVNASGKPADNFVVTDPMPDGVLFAGNESKGAEVSVDGGKTFGALTALKVVDASGQPRAATAADVTHIRWAFARPIASGEHGELRFDAIVK